MGNKIILVLSLFILSCSDPFPTDELYHVDQESRTCEKYKINADNVTFTFEKEIKFEECPDTFGFKASDVGKVTAWIRRTQKKAKKCE